jgi:hypothetical protein
MKSNKYIMYNINQVYRIQYIIYIQNLFIRHFKYQINLYMPMAKMETTENSLGSCMAMEYILLLLFLQNVTLW